MKLSKSEGLVLVITAVLLALMGASHLISLKTRPLGPFVTVTTGQVGTAAPPAEKRVDINSAGLEELMTLPGIGEAKGQAILEYREEHGPFKYVEELICVSGIGESVLADLMEYVTAGGAEDAENSGSG